MTEPLVPAECDLRDFPRMMIDIPRLFASEFDATENDTAWRYGVTLWLKSFHQVPAASLPDDDRQLAKLCGLGRDVATWRTVRSDALRGWALADDGRLYHRVVGEMALECWLEKLAQRLSSGAGNAKRWGADFDPAPIEAEQARAVHCLARLNPKSRALSKIKRKRPDAAPDVKPPEGKWDCDRDADGIPSGSQGEGKGRDKEDASASSSAREQGEAVGEPTPGKRRRRKPEVAIPEGFPDDAAVTWARDRLRAEGANVDAVRQAERFRNHALQVDRRLQDWPAAWRNWVVKGVETAPKLPGWRPPSTATDFAPAQTFTGPPELREELRSCTGGAPEIVKHFLDRCGWRDLPTRTIIAPNGVVASKVRDEVGWRLRELGVEIVVEQAA